MAYVRTTYDAYIFFCDYGQGWEYETMETTRSGMLENRRAYKENSPYPLKIVRRRIKFTADLNKYIENLRH